MIWGSGCSMHDMGEGLLNVLASITSRGSWGRAVWIEASWPPFRSISKKLVRWRSQGLIFSSLEIGTRWELLAVCLSPLRPLYPSLWTAMQSWWTTLVLASRSTNGYALSLASLAPRGCVLREAVEPVLWQLPCQTLSLVAPRQWPSTQ